MGAPKHILIVDDEPPVRELAAMYFQGRGFQVTTASSFEEANQLIDQPNDDFDLVILDIELGAKSGLDLIVPFQKRFPNIPILLFSGVQLTPDQWEKARGEGASGYLRKTQPLEEMLTEVQRLCGPD